MSKEAIERLVPMEESARLGAMVMLLSSVPRPEAIDAISVYPGLGEIARVQHAVNAWENKPRTNHLFVAGTNPNERTQMPLTIEELTKPPINLTRTEGVHAQVYTSNTPSQAEWLADNVEEHGVESLELHVTPFHLTRAFATTIKTFEKRGLETPIIPVPVPIRPSAVIPETGADSVEMFAGEAARIAQYQPKGDVATLEEIRGYVDWLYDQPLIAAQSQ